MAHHPNFDLTEAIPEATRNGDYGPAFETFADDIIVNNGPGAGPWHRALTSLIHETVTAVASGDRFDNLAVYVSRMRLDGTCDRLDTVDLDAEHCVEFWQRNEALPSQSVS
jgi:hypothetical protein